MKIDTTGKVRIGIEIDYYSDNILTFDPEKVLNRVSLFFPDVLIDSTDYSMERVQKVISLANETLHDPTQSDVTNQILAFDRANGPIFRFKIFIKDKIHLIGIIQRYSITFRSEQAISQKMEKEIVNFLKSLNYGQIYSFEKTELFCEKSNKVKDKWHLS